MKEARAISRDWGMLEPPHSHAVSPSKSYLSFTSSYPHNCFSICYSLRPSSEASLAKTLSSNAQKSFTYKFMYSSRNLSSSNHHRHSWISLDTTAPPDEIFAGQRIHPMVQFLQNVLNCLLLSHALLGSMSMKSTETHSNVTIPKVFYKFTVAIETFIQ